jgi:hypothetical protein
MRLVTRGDLDGLTCAVLIGLNEEIDEVTLIHPQDITEGRAEIGPNDIVANLPYDHRCGIWFDHHMHTATPAAPPPDFVGSFGEAPSAARLVYEYYGGAEAMPGFEELVEETDRLDSAQLTPADVMVPKGYIKLGFTVDGRTGLGTFDEYFLELRELLSSQTPIDEILESSEVARRCRILDDQNEEFQQALKNCSRIVDNVVVTDFRGLDRVPVGNRFLIYAIYPEVNVSLRLHWGPDKKFQMVVLGHSIFKRGCNTNVGELAARYGGGGHVGAGSIPLMEGDSEQQIQMILAELRANG